MKGNFLTKGVTLLFLAGLSALGVLLASLFIPEPYHYVGIIFPVVVLYLLGFLASKLDKK